MHKIPAPKVPTAQVCLLVWAQHTSTQHSTAQVHHPHHQQSPNTPASHLPPAPAESAPQGPGTSSWQSQPAAAAAADTLPSGVWTAAATRLLPGAAGWAAAPACGEQHGTPAGHTNTYVCIEEAALGWCSYSALLVCSLPSWMPCHDNNHACTHTQHRDVPLQQRTQCSDNRLLVCLGANTAAHRTTPLLQ